MTKQRRGKTSGWYLAGVFLFFGCLFSLGSAATAQAALADHAVINEVAVDSLVGGGGIEDDWVELYNPTDNEVILDGWSIQKTSASGGSLVKQVLNGAIPARSYFLIVRNNASTTQALKEAADLLVSDSFSLANNNIVYLVNDNVNITGAGDDNIIDFVGFGTASFFEGGAAAPSLLEAESLSRSPDGEDTNDNSVDFVILDTPTPQNSFFVPDNSDDDLGGTVVLTVTPDQEPVQTIGSNNADIVFQVNSNSNAKIFYGLTSSYGSSTPLSAIAKNVTSQISLSNLQCNTVYHYAIFAQDTTGTDSDQTADATFQTLPCGLTLRSLTMTKSTAKANNKYSDGWTWEFDVAVWNRAETNLRMKFDQWHGADTLPAGANMQFSADNGANWHDIANNNAYSATAADISSLDNSTEAGRQVKILVRMKVPIGTGVGFYSSNYGILTE